MRELPGIAAAFDLLFSFWLCSSNKMLEQQSGSIQIGRHCTASKQKGKMIPELERDAATAIREERRISFCWLDKQPVDATCH